uniref:Uncharacterized protein n=1 Tax=Clastoptera arizonana TaxID=38151 RepID=A0A1B6E8F5_9HEMI
MAYNSIPFSLTALAAFITLQTFFLGVQGFSLFNQSNKTDSIPLNNSITVGKKNFGDRLLFMDIVEESMSFFGITGFPTVYDVIFPLPGETNNATISYISAIDKSEENGAHVRVFNGGIGYNNVTIRLQSQPWGKIFYSVQIYGQ